MDRPREDADDDERPVRELGVEDPGFAAAEGAATVSQLTASLSYYEREVLRLRFEQDLTQSEIGARIGCSQMHVSRILRGAVARLQAQAAAELAAGVSQKLGCVPCGLPRRRGRRSGRRTPTRGQSPPARPGCAARKRWPETAPQFPSVQDGGASRP